MSRHVVHTEVDSGYYAALTDLANQLDPDGPRPDPVCNSLEFRATTITYAGGKISQRVNHPIVLERRGAVVKGGGGFSVFMSGFEPVTRSDGVIAVFDYDEYSHIAGAGVLVGGCPHLGRVETLNDRSTGTHLVRFVDGEYAFLNGLQLKVGPDGVVQRGGPDLNYGLAQLKDGRVVNTHYSDPRIVKAALKELAREIPRREAINFDKVYQLIERYVQLGVLFEDIPALMLMTRLKRAVNISTPDEYPNLVRVLESKIPLDWSRLKRQADLLSSGLVNPRSALITLQNDWGVNLDVSDRKLFGDDYALGKLNNFWDRMREGTTIPDHFNEIYQEIVNGEHPPGVAGRLARFLEECCTPDVLRGLSRDAIQEKFQQLKRRPLPGGSIIPALLLSLGVAFLSSSAWAGENASTEVEPSNWQEEAESFAKNFVLGEALSRLGPWGVAATFFV